MTERKSRTRSRAAIALAAGCVLAIGAVAPFGAAADPGQAATSAKKKKKKGLNTTKAVRNAAWGKKVGISFQDGQFTYRSPGLPNHELLDEYAVPNPGVVVPDASTSHIEPATLAIKVQNLVVPITTKPRKASQRTDIKTGPVGVMISGAPVYNPYEGDGSTVAMASNFTLTNTSGQEVPFLDPCNGHPAPAPLSQYHYHGLSTCITRQVDTAKGPSHMIGVAIDGFPIYGDRTIKGKKVKPGSLDRCNGIKSRTPEFPKGKGVYHYVILNVPTEQSTMRCLKGKVRDPLKLTGGEGGYYCALPTGATGSSGRGGFTG